MLVIWVDSMWETSIFGFSLSEAYFILKPLALFMIGMALYAIFIFKFYKFISRRDIFGAPKEGEAPPSTGLRIFQYLFLYPVALFFWYVVFFSLILLLVKTQTVETVMLMAMAMIGAIRITAYFKEELSTDLAKIMPLALLAIFLLDIGTFSITASFEVIKATFTSDTTLHILIYYFLFIIMLEFILRVAHHIGSTAPSSTRLNILELRQRKKEARQEYEQAEQPKQPE